MKCRSSAPAARRLSVRPLAGAGIEIVWKLSDNLKVNVRPLAGAGIEIYRKRLDIWRLPFAPSLGRELKLVLASMVILNASSPPRGGGN